METLLQLGLAGIAGQSVRVALGLTDAYLKRERVNPERYITSLLIGGAGGASIGYYLVGEVTHVSVVLALLGGLSLGYTIEKLYKILKFKEN